MANIKSAKKRIRTTAKKTNNNNYWKKSVKTALSSLTKAISQKESKENLNKLNNKFKSVVDKAAKRKVISRQKSSRLKSKYQKLV